MIRDIWTDGYNVQKEIIKRFKNEDSAYKFEEKMIASIGLDNLTNITKGGRSVCFNQLKERNDAKRLIKSIARGFHILDKNKEIQLRFCGILIDLDKTSVLEMFHRGLSKVTSVLGESLVNKEFSKYGVVIANND